MTGTGNRAQRRFALKQAKKAMREPWSRWEWRSRAADHSEAPQGLIKACLNNVYSVQFFAHSTDWGVIEHLMVRRHDAKPVRSWSGLQRVKSELAGTERVEIEVYPAESQLVDQANIYHLYVLPQGFELPFGLHLSN